MHPRNYYDLLGIAPNATQGEIRSAYYIQARVIHPDRFDPVSQKKEWQKANEMLAELNAAYAVLRDSSKRAEYDGELGYGRAAPSSGSGEEARSKDRAGDDSRHKQREQTRKTSAQSDRERTTTSSEKAQAGPTYLRFSTLPQVVKNKLLSRQQGKGEHLPWRTKTLWLELGCVAFGLLAITIVFFSTNDYRWKGNQPISFGAMSIIGALAMCFGVLGLRRWKLSPMKAFVFITPLYFIKARFDDIWYWGLWQVVDINSVNHYTNGVYSYTTVNFLFDEGRESLKVKSLTASQHLFNQLNTWRLRSSEAAKQGNWEYFAEHDDFFEIHGKVPNDTPKRAFELRVWSIGLVVALVCGLSIGVVADQLNRYFDDKKSWDDATAVNRVSSYRKYLDTHSAGRWAVEATQRINQQYDSSASHYQTSRSPGFDKAASEAILSVLAYAKQTQHYRVRVAFERHNEIAPNIEQQLRQQFGASNILSVGDSFSDDKMRLRENEILSAVGAAFKEVIPQDILEFTDSGSPDSGVVFLITYKMRAGKALYYRVADSHIPAYSRPYYPGIYVSWDFEMRIPTEPRAYNFSLESNPAKEITYQTSSYGAPNSIYDLVPTLKPESGSITNNSVERNSLYDQMAVSAFDDFRRELVKRLGLKETSAGSAATIPVSTPTPTPDITGTYTNEFGSLEIEPDTKGFSFGLNVGTGRCTGAISGTAKWSRNGIAVYRAIPDRELYANPESFYYQKTCQLTFKFSGNRFQVSQTDACNYFHGAECDFNGTYHR